MAEHVKGHQFGSEFDSTSNATMSSVPDSPEATRLLERLYEVIQEEFKDASVNILTSLSIHDLAKKKIQAIMDLITSIKADFEDERAWRVFDGYVDDIYTLEECVYVYLLRSVAYILPKIPPQPTTPGAY